MTGVERGSEYRVVARHERFSGPVFDVLTDEVTMPDGEVRARDWVRHVGAVGIVALDDEDRVVLVRQYRHPIGRRTWELPAGLVDVSGEPLAAVAARELSEEADLLAGRLDLLVDLHLSPGYSTETIRIFLARDLTEVPAADRHRRSEEEAEMQVARVPLADAIGMVFTGQVSNAAAVGGLLATDHARRDGWRPLRPADAPAL